jgi:ribonuclease P protein component
VKQFSYSKKENLKSKKLTEELFSRGKSFNLFPLRIIYLEKSDITTPVQAGVSTGTRFFKKAVDRNRVKRLLREAYRKEKLPLQDFLQQQNKKIIFFIIYTHKELPEWAALQKKMQLALQKLIMVLNEKNSADN